MFTTLDVDIICPRFDKQKNEMIPRRSLKIQFHMLLKQIIRATNLILTKFFYSNG